VVRGDLGGPLAGFGWGVKGSRGSHELGDGYVSVEAMDIVGKARQPRSSSRPARLTA
jgi:hypothetical protein